VPLTRSREPADDPLDLLFYALSDRTRRRLLTRLTLGPAKVTDLARPFRMSLPAVSKHLKVLERARLVSRTVRGRVHRLALQGETLEEVETWLDPFRAFWEDQLTELARDLDRHPPGRESRNPLPERMRRPRSRPASNPREGPSGKIRP
jgi:DNA-binding transcriptional ArsR family regulator